MKKIIIALLILFQAAVGYSASEDFSTYTENDPNSDITITGTGNVRIDVVTMRRDVSARVYKDFTADHFGDFQIRIAIKPVDGSGNGSTGAFLALSNSAPPDPFAESGIMLKILYTNYLTNSFTIDLWDGTSADSWSGGTETTWYQVILTRSGSSITCEIWDIGETGLIDTLTGTNSTAYQYLAVAASRNATPTDSLDVTFSLSDVEIVSASSPATGILWPIIISD